MKQLQFDFTSNLGGLARMFAIPTSSYHQLRRDYTTSLNYLEVINRDDIIDLYFSEDTEGFSEAYEKGVYKVEISGIVPKSNPLNTDQLRRLDSEYWFVLIQDNNDFIRLAGTEENQLSFSRTDISGQISSRNQIEFLFSGSQTESCAFITLDEMDKL